MTTARINLSHGTLKENLKLINKFKQAKRLRPHKTCALMIEVRGREIRMSHVDEKVGTLKIRTGSVVTVTCGEFWKASEANNIKINNETI
jgi:pyruvate kinase